MSIRWFIFNSVVLLALLQPSAGMAQNAACAVFEPTTAFRAELVRVRFTTAPTAPAPTAPPAAGAGPAVIFRGPPTAPGLRR